MSALSYARLENVLSDVTDGEFDATAHYERIMVASADAWATVDSLHRVREVLIGMPRSRKRGELFEGFIRAVAPARELRNSVQHLQSDLRSRDLVRSTVWGTITWIWGSELHPNSCRLGAINAGTDPGGIRHKLINPTETGVFDGIWHATLTLGSTSLDLSVAIDAMVKLARGLEKGLLPEIGDMRRATADYLVVLEAKLGGA